MQTEYRNTHNLAVEGMPVGPRKTRSFGLPWQAQADQIRIADASAAASETWTVSITDDLTGQVWSYTFLSGAALADTLDNWVAAHRLNAKANSLFTVTEDGVDDFLPVARHANRTYTWAVTPGGSATATITNLTAAGGDGIEMGRFVVRAGDGNMQQIAATSVLADIVGGVFRTDANHLHSLENDTVDAIDTLSRGKHHAVIESGRMWVKVEEAVEEGDRVYCRRALTSSAGRIGGFRASPAGSAQTLTLTPIVNQAIYGVKFTFVWEGARHVISAIYMPTDATTSIADACAGLFDALSTEITAHGLTGQLTPTDNATSVTIATLAGTEIIEPSGNVWYLDTEAATVTVSNGAADVDTIDVTDIAEYESDAAADGFALLRIKLAG